MCLGYAQATAHFWQAGDNLQEFVLFCHVGPGDQPQVIRHLSLLCPCWNSGISLGLALFSLSSNTVCLVVVVGDEPASFLSPLTLWSELPRIGKSSVNPELTVCSQTHVQPPNLSLPRAGVIGVRHHARSDILEQEGSEQKQYRGDPCITTQLRHRPVPSARGSEMLCRLHSFSPSRSSFSFFMFKDFP